jgi:hypothetical protein
MVRSSAAVVLTMLTLVSCSSSHATTPANVKDGAPDGSPAATTGASNEDITDAGAAQADVTAKDGAPATKKEPSPGDLAAYLKANVPKGGTVHDGSPPKIIHHVKAGDSAASLAKQYLALTEIYYERDLEKALAKKKISPGAEIEIPGVLTRPIRAPREEVLGWPEDKALRGVFVTGSYAGVKWPDTLDKLAERGLNAVVLDGKDYEGYVNYPSKAKIAVESGAIREKYIPDLARAIRFAHWRGIRVIIRIPCFHDPWADKHLPDKRLSIRYTPTGKPIHINWIDPALPESQDYAIELAKEAIEAGADEIQLDYVRFPVHLSSKVAVLPPPEQRSKIMRDFVKRVRAVTKEAGIYLSLDFFGVAATGVQSDIDKLGQDIATVAPEADVISLMAYASHYGKGYMGWNEPADHPEIVAIANKAALKKLKPTGAKTIFRTWLQAFPLRVTHYGPKYVVDQARHAEESGGVGWLMWSPGCEYSAVWRGWPVINGQK